jgi:Fe-Mn family superoxide dismutase
MENISRRKFVAASLKAGAITAVMPLVASAENMSIFNSSALAFSQVKLPYDYSALEPHIDAMTMEIHYTKHHAAYIKNVNDAIAADKITAATEKEFFANASKLSAKAKNNGGGAWNHNFFWEVMKPNGGGTPSGKIADAISGTFGSFQAFKDQFSTAAKDRFGSGWAWLVNDNGKLKIGSTANQDNPLMDSSELKGTPLLGIDVWEHAYYLKYQNKRPDYITAWFNVINWDEVAKRLA